MMELKKTVYSKILCSSCEMVHVLENATESSTKHQICQDFSLLREKDVCGST